MEVADGLGKKHLREDLGDSSKDVLSEDEEKKKKRKKNRTYFGFCAKKLGLSESDGVSMSSGDEGSSFCSLTTMRLFCGGSVAGPNKPLELK